VVAISLWYRNLEMSGRGKGVWGVRRCGGGRRVLTLAPPPTHTLRATRMRWLHAWRCLGCVCRVSRMRVAVPRLVVPHCAETGLASTTPHLCLPMPRPDADRRCVLACAESSSTRSWLRCAASFVVLIAFCHALHVDIRHLVAIGRHILVVSCVPCAADRCGVHWLQLFYVVASSDPF